MRRARPKRGAGDLGALALSVGDAGRRLRAAQLRTWLVACGVPSQTCVADMAGVSCAYVSRCLSGRQRASYKLARALAELTSSPLGLAEQALDFARPMPSLYGRGRRAK